MTSYTIGYYLCSISDEGRSKTIAVSYEDGQRCFESVNCEYCWENQEKVPCLIGPDGRGSVADVMMDFSFIESSCERSGCICLVHDGYFEREVSFKRDPDVSIIEVGDKPDWVANTRNGLKLKFKEDEDTSQPEPRGSDESEPWKPEEWKSEEWKPDEDKIDSKDD